MARLSKQVFNCIKKYSLIEKGDKVAVGVSGGKDSMSLLSLIHPFREKLGFSLTAIHITLREEHPSEWIKELKLFCKNKEIELIIKKTNILDYLDRLKLKKDVCFLCAHNRRKEIFLKMQELGIDKLALGHHKDDAIETFLMNIFYSSQTCTMMPKQSLFKGKIKLIRPLYTTKEKSLISYSERHKIPVFDYGCSNSCESKRFHVKQFLKTLEKDNRRVPANIFRAMHNINLEYLPYDFD